MSYNNKVTKEEAEETKVFVCDETIEKYKVLEDKLMSDEDLIKIETHIRNLQKKIGYYKSQLEIKEKLIAKLINL